MVLVGRSVVRLERRGINEQPEFKNTVYVGDALAGRRCALSKY